MATIRITRAADVRQYETFELDTDELSDEQISALGVLRDEGNIDENGPSWAFSELREMLIYREPVDTDFEEAPDHDNMNFISK